MAQPQILSVSGSVLAEFGDAFPRARQEAYHCGVSLFRVRLKL